MENKTPSETLGTTGRVPQTSTYQPRVITSSDEPYKVNQTMFQGFEWYGPADNKHWTRLAEATPSLALLGITSMWIPPASKTAWKDDNGYAPYDLYDLGEFDQKGATSTKWGNKEDLVAFVEIANSCNIAIIFDAVLNHKAGADYAERVRAVKVDPDDRTTVIGKPEVIEAWTGFDFKGRAGAYSSMRWNKNHFTGVDYDNKSNTNAVWRFKDKSWAYEVDEELGNYDYLMFADIDHSNTEVREDLFHWVQWLSSQLKLGGLRLDAVKHYSAKFLRDFLVHIDQTVDQHWFIVGEYLRDESDILARYIDYMNNRISLFDVRLLGNICRLSLKEDSDLRTILQGSLAILKPHNTVTFVTNHDTQPGRSFEAYIAPFFVPIAYAFILLRADTGLPCVFYADLYGSFGLGDGANFIPPACRGLILPKIILTRCLYAYGTQIDYLDKPNCIGFTRLGHSSKSGGAGLAAIMTNGLEAMDKRMNVGKQHAGERWTDIIRCCWGEVVIGEDGWGVFGVGPRSVSIWVSKTAFDRERLDKLVFDQDFFKFEEDPKSSETKPETKAKTNLKERGGEKSYPAWLLQESMPEGDISASSPAKRATHPI